MPRLCPQLLRRARSLSPDLATILPACRDINSATNELRWLKEHVEKSSKGDKQQYLTSLCRKRGRGVPLQYLLGSQPFGLLDILCRPGVLIPRPETEAYAHHLVDLIKSGTLLGQKLSSGSGGLNILDFCTGTGCIPLVLFSALQSSAQSLSVRGVDLSPTALRLASENLAHNLSNGSIRQPGNDQSLSFIKADVFNDGDIQMLASGGLDLMISNPPYVSKDIWYCGRGHMGYSVRKYEPRLALVPGNHLPIVPKGLNQEDVFYSRLLDIASMLKPKALLLEVGDEEQARRVVGFYHRHAFSSGTEIEIWRDWPSLSPVQGQADLLHSTTSDEIHWEAPIIGEGNVRAIFIKSRAA